MFTVVDAQYNWYVPEGITLDRTDGAFPYWILAQYFDEIDLQLDQTTVHALPGSILIIPPYTPHKYTCVMPLHHHWMHLQGDLNPLLDHYRLSPLKLYLLRNNSDISTLFRSISLSYHSTDPYRDEYMSLKTEEMLILISTYFHLQESNLDLGFSRMRNLEELRCQILEHPEAEWTIPNMAAQLYVSQPYFYSIYRQRFGITPAQDVQNIRMERACLMLRDGTPVSVTAKQCGYHNVYHFIRQFKKICGITPGNYLKLCPRIGPWPTRFPVCSNPKSNSETDQAD